jgi:hypothetical protein
VTALDGSGSAYEYDSVTVQTAEVSGPDGKSGADSI